MYINNENIETNNEKEIIKNNLISENDNIIKNIQLQTDIEKNDLNLEYNNDNTTMKIQLLISVEMRLID